MILEHEKLPTFASSQKHLGTLYISFKWSQGYHGTCSYLLVVISTDLLKRILFHQFNLIVRLMKIKLKWLRKPNSSLRCCNDKLQRACYWTEVPSSSGSRNVVYGFTFTERTGKPKARLWRSQRPCRDILGADHPSWRRRRAWTCSTARSWGL